MRIPKTTLRETVRSARFSISFCGILFVGFVLGLIFQNLPQFLALQPFGHDSWGRFYTLFTYWIIHPGFLFWLRVSISFVLSGLILERGYPPSRLAILIIGGIVVGGTVYAEFEATASPLVGSSTGAWCYAGATITVIARTWRNSSLLAKLYSVYLFASFFLAFDTTSVAVAQYAAGIFGVGFALFCKPATQMVNPNPALTQ